MTDELIGRDDVIVELRAARLRGAPGVVIAGSPGMGRSSVLTHIVDEWQSRRADVVLLRPTLSARSLRFAVLSSLVTGDIDGPLTFDAVAAALEQRAANGSFVLAVDDLHLLDPSSAHVIADFARRPGRFVVATIDERWLGLDPLTSGGRLDVVHLGPLDPAAVARIVTARTGTTSNDAWWERCQGNPTALLDALARSRQRSRPAPGRAATTSADGLDEGEPGLAWFDSATSELSTDTRRLLAVVALAEPFPVDAAVAACGSASVDELLAAGIVTATDGTDGSGADHEGRAGPDPVIRLRHPAHAQQIRRRLGALELRGARRTALLALRGRWPQLTPLGRLRLAGLALDSGVPLDDVELAEVARLAPVAGDPTLALRLAREAAHRLGRFEDHRLLADVAHEQGEIDDLLSAIDGMERLATAPEHATAVAVARAQHLLWRSRDAQGAAAALDGVDPVADPETAAVRARLLATIGRTVEGIDAARPLLDHPSPRVRTQAALGTAHALRLLGRPARAGEVLDAALDASGAVEDPVLSVSRQVLSTVQVLARVDAGRWADACESAGRVISYAERYDEAPGRAVALLSLGIAELESGRPAVALEPLTEALELFERLRQPAGERWATAARALAHALMGDARSAAHDLGQLDRIGPHPADLLPSLAPRARAWTAVAAADPEAARQVLLDAVASCTASGHHGAAWACAHDLVPLDRPQVLLELEPIPDEPLCELRRRHARAVQTKDLEELSQLTDTFESLGSWRWAAESAAALSRAAARVGAKQVVRRAGDRLATLTARCSGLSVPSVSIGAALTLSVREREIALLAARGLTSRAIGERLGLSIRTVDNHLARCFDKLRVSSRADLAEALGS